GICYSKIFCHAFQIMQSTCIVLRTNMVDQQRIGSMSSLLKIQAKLDLTQFDEPNFGGTIVDELCNSLKYDYGTGNIEGKRTDYVDLSIEEPTKQPQYGIDI
ncbi:hypothetical protein ACJX0J_018247, partial [Zea mays]